MLIIRNLYNSSLAFFFIILFSITSLQSCEEEVAKEPTSSRALVPFQPRSDSLLSTSPSTVKLTRINVTRACMEAGHFYFHGGFHQFGISYYIAAALGCRDPEALCIVGKLCEHGFPTKDGIVIPKTLVRSLTHYGFLTSQGSETRKPWFKRRFRFEQNLALAAIIYQGLINKGFEAARPLLANLYLQAAIQKHYMGNYARAFKLFSLAGGAGNAQAVFKLGKMCENHEVDVADNGKGLYVSRLEMAERFYVRAQEMGHPEAEIAVYNVRSLVASHQRREQMRTRLREQMRTRFLVPHRPFAAHGLLTAPPRSSPSPTVNFGFDSDSDGSIGEEEGVALGRPAAGASPTSADPFLSKPAPPRAAMDGHFEEVDLGVKWVTGMGGFDDG
jgi:hypothetical protein